MPPCTRFIAREDPHSKCILCLGFSHAREAVYGTSNCEICDDFRLITLRSVKELRRATDLALRATKHTARAVGRSMAASVAAERHLWLNLTEIRERRRRF